MFLERCRNAGEGSCNWLYGPSAYGSIGAMIAILIISLLTTAVPHVQEELGDPYLHYLKASYYLREGQPQKAISELELAIQADPESADLRVAYGQLLFGTGRSSEALMELEKAYTLDPSNINALKLIGQVHLQGASQGGREAQAEAIKKAEEAFKKALEIDWEDRQSLLLLIHIYENSGRIEDAVAVKQRFLTAYPTSYNMWLSLADSYSFMGNRSEEFGALEKALDLSAGDPEVLRRAGSAAESLGRHKEALGYYDKSRGLLQQLTGDNPEEPYHFLMLGELCLRYTGQYDIALEAFNRAMELSSDPDLQGNLRSQAAVGKATTLASLREYEKAAELFGDHEDWVLTRQTYYIGALLSSYANSGKADRALEIVNRFESRVGDNSSLAGFLGRMRAQVLADSGRVDGAVKVLEKLISGSPGELENFIQLSNVHFQNKDYDIALAALDRIAAGGAGEAESEDVMFQRSLILEQKGDLPKARAILEHLIIEDSDNHVALNNLGYMLAVRGEELDLALGYVERAVELQPYQGSYLDSLGWIYYLKGDMKNAQRYLEEAARTNYNSAEVREHLGYLYLALGRYRDSLSEFKESIARNLADVKSTAEVEKEIAKLEKLLEDK